MWESTPFESAFPIQSLSYLLDPSSSSSYEQPWDVPDKLVADLGILLVMAFSIHDLSSTTVNSHSVTLFALLWFAVAPPPPGQVRAGQVR